MGILRKVALTSAMAIGLALPPALGLAQAQQKFPSKPVRIVVGFSAGSATDITARLLGPKLSEKWGQPVVVENRPGGSGVIAANIVAKAAPDGYTLLLISSAFAVSAALQPNLGYEPLKDFVGVTQLGFTTQVVVAAPSLGIKSVSELTALAHERPGKLLFGSAGAGSGTHISAEMFRMAAGIKATHVGFKGQPEFLVEIMAGRVHFAIASLGPALPLIREGRVMPLAVLTSKRAPVLPEVPSISEVIPGYEREGSHGLVAPASTPRAVLNQIAHDIARVCELADVKERLLAIGFVPATTTPDDYTRILRAQIETYSKVVRVAGLRP
jgi:tripartite-type tricarboxylate transporter receptor subunit TctC